MLRHTTLLLTGIYCFMAIAAGAVQAAQQAPAGTHVEVSGEEISACGDDVKRLCSNEFPDEAKVIACMRANRTALSPACIPVFKAGLKRRGL